MKSNKIILKRPLVTEKATMLSEKNKVYVFEVDLNANKIEISQAIEKKFSVKVASVKTMRMKGKRKAQLTRKGRFEGKKADWKKALVTLKEGFELNLFENV
jgi:large subunit ribosomal protein L23